jgi:sigma-54-interacting transcriptional regulator
MTPDSMQPTTEEGSHRFEADMNIAARFNGPVLITATPLDALNIAREIADRADRSVRVAGASRGNRHGPPEVLICDPAAGDDIVAAMADARRRFPADRRTRFLLLRDIQVLKPAEQAALHQDLADRQSEAPGSSTRIIASSSIDLYGCVARGAFDARLFYRLNAIHIVAPSWPRAMATV